jgi:uncharacterized membrane protein
MMGKFGGFGGEGFVYGPKGEVVKGAFGYGDFGGGFSWMGFIPMALHALICIALIVAGIYLFRHWLAVHKKSSNNALRILDERVVRGEITTEEYKEIKKHLLS